MSFAARRFTLALVLLVAAAFALRLVTRAELERDGLRLLSPDDYGHLRRAAATVRDFPRVPYADPFLAHPSGGRWIWPPLFDLAIAAPGRLFWGAEAPLDRLAALAAWLAPTLGALALVPLALGARRLFGARTAIVAAGAYALQPAAIAWSAFGHSDQHVGEALALLALLAALVRWLDSEPQRGGALALVAAALGAAVLTWQGAVFLAPLVALVALLAGRARGGALALAGSAALVLPFAWAAGGPTTYISFGPFQPSFLALCAALIGIASLGRGGLAAAAGLGVLAAWTWPPITGGIEHLLRSSEGAAVDQGYLSYPKEWLALIGEYRPLFGRGVQPVVAQLTLGVLAVPLAWVLWLREARERRRAVLLPLVVILPVVGAMAIAQRRYIYYLAPFVALALADLGCRLAARQRLAGAAAVVLALLPSLGAFGELRAAPGAPGHDLLRTLERVAELAPPPGDPLRPESAAGTPGMMAPWSIGHYVTLYARRPAVADNLGYGFLEQSRFFTTPPQEDREALDQLVRLRCAWVFVSDLRPALTAYAAAAGRAGIDLEATLAMRLLRSPAERPLPFLRLEVVSQGLAPDERGELRPRFKIYRVETPAAGPPSG